MSPPTEVVRMAKLEKSFVTSDEAHSGHAMSVRPSEDTSSSNRCAQVLQVYS